MKAKTVKESINENLMGTFIGPYENERIDVYKNPRTLVRLQKWVRGCSDMEGNLYVADSQNVMHNDIAEFLRKHKKINLIDWQRFGNSNTFYLAEGYDLNLNGLADELSDEEKEMIKTSVPMLRKNFPMFTFIENKTIIQI